MLRSLIQQYGEVRVYVSVELVGGWMRSLENALGTTNVNNLVCKISKALNGNSSERGHVYERVDQRRYRWRAQSEFSCDLLRGPIVLILSWTNFPDLCYTCRPGADVRIFRLQNLPMLVSVVVVVLVAVLVGSLREFEGSCAVE